MVCGGYVKCGGDFLMKEQPTVIKELKEITDWLNQHTISISHDADIAFYVLESFREHDPVAFEKNIADIKCSFFVHDYLYGCIKEEWNEGILICEREITKRGLNKVGVKERFEL